MNLNGETYRYAVTKMSDIKFEYLDYATSLEEIVNRE